MVVVATRAAVIPTGMSQGSYICPHHPIVFIFLWHLFVFLFGITDDMSLLFSLDCFACAWSDWYALIVSGRVGLVTGLHFLHAPSPHTANTSQHGTFG